MDDPAADDNDLPVLRRCGIPSESELQEVFLLLCRSHRRICGRIRAVFSYKKLVPCISDRRGGFVDLSGGYRNGFPRFLPEKPVVWEGAAAGRFSCIFLSDHESDPEYRPSCAGTPDRAYGGNAVLCRLIDRKDTCSSGGSCQYHHYFLSDKAAGENGKKTVPDVYRNRTGCELCVLYRIPDRDAPFCMAVLP